MKQNSNIDVRKRSNSWLLFLFGLLATWCWLSNEGLAESEFELPVAVKTLSLDNSTEAFAGDTERALRNRLVAVAILVGVLVAMVAVIYGYLKLELVTRGFYSGRLQAAAAAATLVVAAVAYFLWLALKTNLVGVS